MTTAQVVDVGSAPLSVLGLPALVDAAREATRLQNLAGVTRLDAAYSMVLSAERIARMEVDDARTAGRPPKPEYARLEPQRLARSHVATAMTLTGWHAGRLVDAAVQLHTRLRRLNSAAREGVLDEATIVSLACRLRDVPDAILPAVEAEVVRSVMRDVDEGNRPSRESLGDRVDRAMERRDPDEVDRAAEEAREERRVTFRSAGRGMTSMSASLTSEDAAALRDRLHDIARSVDHPDDPRTARQRVADALVELARPGGDRGFGPEAGSTGPEGNPPAPSSRPLHITVIGAAAEGLPSRVEFVRGAYSAFDWLCGKVLAEESGGARFELVDPAPGAEDCPEAALKYFLSAAMERRIRLRDGTCRHPGCCVPTEDCEIDHVIAFDHLRPEFGGPTAEWNLICLCKAHHQEKTFGRWAYRPGALGELVITTETGHQYRTRPRGMLALARDDLLGAARDHRDDRIAALVADDGHLTNPPGATRPFRPRDP